MDMTAFANDLLREMGAAQVLPERPLSPPDPGNLTDAEINGIQAAIELKAADEFDEFSQKFQDWLSGGAGKQIKRDYIAYRAATLSADEELELFHGL